MFVFFDSRHLMRFGAHALGRRAWATCGNVCNKRFHVQREGDFLHSRSSHHFHYFIDHHEASTMNQGASSMWICETLDVNVQFNVFTLTIKTYGCNGPTSEFPCPGCKASREAIKNGTAPFKLDRPDPVHWVRPPWCKTLLCSITLILHDAMSMSNGFDVCLMFSSMNLDRNMVSTSQQFFGLTSYHWTTSFQTFCIWGKERCWSCSNPSMQLRKKTSPSGYALCFQYPSIVYPLCTAASTSTSRSLPQETLCSMMRVDCGIPHFTFLEENADGHKTIKPVSLDAKQLYSVSDILMHSSARTHKFRCWKNLTCTS